MEVIKYEEDFPRENIERIAASLENILRVNGIVELAQGSNAIIYTLENSVTGLSDCCCIKINKPSPKFYSDLEEEYRIHKKAYSLGVRVPKPRCLLNLEVDLPKRGKGIYTCFIMEKINGFDITEIENNDRIGSLETDELKCPTKYSTREAKIKWNQHVKIFVENFMRELESNVKTLNDNKICHRDLTPRNVMVRSKDGLPMIVDFGLSIIADPESDLAWQHNSSGVISGGGKSFVQGGFVRDREAMSSIERALLRKLAVPLN